jgi:hypothetical protein
LGHIFVPHAYASLWIFVSVVVFQLVPVPPNATLLDRHRQIFAQRNAERGAEWPYQESLQVLAAEPQKFLGGN